MKPKELGALWFGALLIATLSIQPASAAPTGDPSDGNRSTGTSNISVATIVGKSLSFSGRVRRGDGTPLPGANVRVFAWPVGLDRIAEGDSFSLIDVGGVVADTAGNFTISPDTSIILSLAASTQEASATKLSEIPVDLEVVAETVAGQAFYASTIFVQPSTNMLRIDIAREAEANDRSTASATSAGIAVDLRVLKQVDPPITPDVQPLDVVHNCTLTTDYGGLWTVVGSIGATTSGYTGQMKYSSGASSAITEGISVNGAYGTFTSNGTISRSTTSSVTFPSYSASGYWQMRTKFTYGKFVCQWGATGGTRYVVRVTGWIASTNQVAVSTPSATKCGPFSAGSEYEENNTTAVTFTSSVSGMYSLIGFNLSSRTGYTNKAQLHYKFTSARNLCGVGAYPGSGNPYQLVVKP